MENNEFLYFDVAMKPGCVNLDWRDFERLARELCPLAAIKASDEDLHLIFDQSLMEISKITGGKVKAAIDTERKGCRTIPCKYGASVRGIAGRVNCAKKRRL